MEDNQNVSVPPKELVDKKLQAKVGSTKRKAPAKAAVAWLAT